MYKFRILALSLCKPILMGCSELMTRNGLLKYTAPLVTYCLGKYFDTFESPPLLSLSNTQQRNQVRVHYMSTA